MRAGAEIAWKPDCGAWAILKRPTCIVFVTAPSRRGARLARSESTPVATLDCATNVAISRAVFAQRLTLSAGEAGECEPASGSDRHGREDLRGEHAEDRLAQTVVRADGHSRQPEAHRPRKQQGPYVVAAPQKEDGPAEPFERLTERKARCEQQRNVRASGREEREDDETDRCERGAGELEPERVREEAAQSTPSSRVEYRKPYLTTASSTVRSKNDWKNDVAKSTVA